MQYKKIISEAVSGTILNPIILFLRLKKSYIFVMFFLFRSAQKGNELKVKALESKQPQFAILQIHSKSRLEGM